MAVTATDAADKLATDFELEALRAIFCKLGGDSWLRRDGWAFRTSPLPLSRWQGVGTDDAGRVISLELSCNNLEGRLEDVADALLALPALQQLWLSENALRGPLPRALATAPALTVLDLGSNKLRGTIPPEFAANPRISWFEISGNQLSAFFRFDEGASAIPPPHLLASTSITVPCFAALAAAGPPSSIWNIRTTSELLIVGESDAIVAAAENWASDNGGWQTNRHRAYQTTDLDVRSSPELLALCNQLLRRLLPLLSQLFGFALEDLAVDDLFVVKYSAGSGDQSSLEPHRDDSELSFVVLLGAAFGGGGTRFLDCEPAVLAAPEAVGTALLFCGRQLHEGVAISSGTRYILAGFVRVHASSAGDAEKLRTMEEQAALLRESGAPKRKKRLRRE